MTTYFDKKADEIRDIIAYARAGTSDVYEALLKFEEVVVWDVTLVAEWPGCPPEIRDAIHKAVLRYAPNSQPTGVAGPDYKDLAAQARGLADMVERLHDVFHDLAKAGHEEFSDGPSFPLRRLFYRGDERREQLSPVPLAYWKRTITSYDEGDRPAARERVRMRVFDYAVLTGKHPSDALEEADKAMAYLTAEESNVPHVIRSPLGFYAGGDDLRWLPAPSPLWLFGSKAAAEERIRERGFPKGWAEAVPYPPALRR